MGADDFYFFTRLLDDAIFNDDYRYRVEYYNQITHCMKGLQFHPLYRKRKNNTLPGVVFSFGSFVSLETGTAFTRPIEDLCSRSSQRSSARNNHHKSKF